jgi:hypothetical protein
MGSPPARPQRVGGKNYVPAGSGASLEAQSGHAYNRYIDVKGRLASAASIGSSLNSAKALVEECMDLDAAESRSPYRGVSA